MTDQLAAEVEDLGKVYGDGHGTNEGDRPAACGRARPHAGQDHPAARSVVVALLTTVIGVRHHCGRPEKQPNSQSSPRSTPGPTECNHQ
jgi:hypothetical protein